MPFMITAFERREDGRRAQVRNVAGPYATHREAEAALPGIRFQTFHTVRGTFDSWAIVRMAGPTDYPPIFPAPLKLHVPPSANGWLPLGLQVRARMWTERYMASRAPDLVIGDDYLRRWWVRPRTETGPNVYLHQILRSDDDRALHDHPWPSTSVILSGGYFEHTIEAGGVHKRRWRSPGLITSRPANAAHRLEVSENIPAITLFFTGVKEREWGFHCPNGWRHWKDFTNPDDPTQAGRGCE